MFIKQSFHVTILFSENVPKLFDLYKNDYNSSLIIY